MKLRSKAAAALAVGAAVLVGVNLVTATAAAATEIEAPEPVFIEGNVNSCSDLGDGWFDLFTSGGEDNDYTGPEGTGTLESNDADADKEVLNVTVNAGYTAFAIIVKGGPNAYAYPLFDFMTGEGTPGPFEINGLVAPQNGGDNTPGVSHWLVCGYEEPPCLEEEEVDVPKLTGVVAQGGEGEPEPCVTPTPTPEPTTPQPSTPTSSLPVTGTSLTGGTLTGIVGAGIALLAAGAALMFLRRRRATVGE
jgi:hypothetical protein